MEKHIDEPSNNKPSSDKPSSDKPSSDKPSNNKPSSDKPSSDKPSSDKPSSDKPSSDKPSSDKPSNNKPSSYRSNRPVRKVFLYNGDIKQPITAAGLFLTKLDNNGKLNILVQDVDINNIHPINRMNRRRITDLGGRFASTELITDLGGKVDSTDTSIIFTVARELYEESNGALYYSTENDNKNDNKQYLSIENLEKIIYNNEYKQFYTRASKYLLYFVKLPTSINIDFEKSGDFEACDKIKRNLQWITLADLLNKYSQHKVHIRLCDKPIIAYLRSIV